MNKDQFSAAKPYRPPKRCAVSRFPTKFDKAESFCEPHQNAKSCHHPSKSNTAAPLTLPARRQRTWHFEHTTSEVPTEPPKCLPKCLRSDNAVGTSNTRLRSAYHDAINHLQMTSSQVHAGRPHMMILTGDFDCSTLQLLQSQVHGEVLVGKGFSTN